MYIHVQLSFSPTLLRPESEKIYGFSEFACSLNEPEVGVAPTDSRLRPDQRIMEEGDFDRANSEKVQILVYMPQASCMSTVLYYACKFNQARFPELIYP